MNHAATAPRRRLVILALACVVVHLGDSTVRAQARRRFRARFEPTTLELDRPGQVEFDLQFGALYGDGSDGSRLIAPDFEIDLGITRWLELDLDGGFTVTHFDHRAPTRRVYGTPFWTSAKLALYGRTNAATGRNVGVGFQLGPRFPSLRTAHGVGFGALLLAGGGTRRVNVVASIGTMIDRGQSPGLVYGVDISIALDAHSTWSLVGELGGGHYFGSTVPNQLSATFGVAVQASGSVGLSLIGLGGLLRGNDRLGLLAGLSTTFGRPPPPHVPAPAPN